MDKRQKMQQKEKCRGILTSKKNPKLQVEHILPNKRKKWPNFIADRRPPILNKGKKYFQTNQSKILLHLRFIPTASITLLQQKATTRPMAGEAVLSAFMQVLFEKFYTAAATELRSIRGVAKQLEGLTTTLSMIQALLEDAEEKQLTDKSVRIWLSNLKDVAYEMDELLDEYEAQHLRLEMEDRARKLKKANKVIGFLSPSYFYEGLLRYKAANRIKAIRNKLDNVARERDTLGLQILGSRGRLEIAEPPQTSSLVDDLNVFGRHEDRENIVKKLLSNTNTSSRKNFSILPIVGMGGIGKTTLAQIVYNDDRVKEYFQLRMWICVSENFDEMKLTKEVLQSALGGSLSTATSGGLSAAMSGYLSTASGSLYGGTNMNLLQQELCDNLKGKRFLLVLDDVWNENPEKWERFCLTMQGAGEGSKIIVTTQNISVALVMGGLAPYYLKRLSNNDCWNLFRNYAFVDGNSSGHPNLVEIGMEIVKKLRGLPLAAKALGSLLYSKLEEEEWMNILRSEIWELPREKNHILPALRLSYKHLPPYLKQCFAFCSVFHKDYIFRKDKLV